MLRVWSKERMVNLAKEFSTKNSGLFDFSRNLSLSHFKSETTKYQISEPQHPFLSPELHRAFIALFEGKTNRGWYRRYRHSHLWKFNNFYCYFLVQYQHLLKSQLSRISQSAYYKISRALCTIHTKGWRSEDNAAKLHLGTKLWARKVFKLQQLYWIWRIKEIFKKFPCLHKPGCLPTSSFGLLWLKMTRKGNLFILQHRQRHSS